MSNDCFDCAHAQPKSIYCPMMGEVVTNEMSTSCEMDHYVKALKPITYRPFMQITDDELKEIINEIFHCKDGVDGVCVKSRKEDHILVEITTQWGEEDDETITMTDTIEVYPPFSTKPIVVYDFSYAGHEISDFRNYCIAKGLIDETYLTRYLQENS